MSSRQSSLRINQDERRFLGVCAGIADYLDMPVVLVRIIFLISVLTWPTLILAYFALYFWLDRDLSADKVYNWLSGSAPTQHLKNLDYRRPLYRNRRNRKIAGVCSGIADYLEVKPVLVRAVAIIAAFVLGPYALLAYGVCWFVMEPNPAVGGRQRHADRQQRRKTRHERRQARHQRRRARQGFSSSRINTVTDDEIDTMVDEAYSEAIHSEQDLYDDPENLYGESEHLSGSAQSRAGSISQGRSGTAGKATLSSSRLSSNEKTIEECGDIYYTLENRLRELEAYITSKKFRLHCEINRI